MFTSDKLRTITIIYDGDCPVCNAYIRHMRLRENYGKVELLDAREHPQIAREFRDKGMSLDDGMAVRLDDLEFYGPDAVHALGMLSSSSGIFNRLNALIFGNATVSKTLYPIMKAGRALVLKLLGKTKIDNFLDNA